MVMIGDKIADISRSWTAPAHDPADREWLNNWYGVPRLFKKANKGAKQVHACYKMLRETEEGRQAVISLMNDNDPSVRSCAAAHSLQWTPQRARAVLEAVITSNVPWQISFSAEMTLEEYDKGRLTFDY